MDGCSFLRTAASGVLSHGHVHFVLIVFHHGDLVLINVTVVCHPVHDMEDHIGHGQVDAQMVGVVLGVENILAADFRAKFSRMRGKNLQAYWRTAKIFNDAGDKICRKDVRMGLCEQALK